MNQIKEQKNMEFPIRINKYLHNAGYCSRRKADELIEKGQIEINGKRAVLGQKVNKNDVVNVSDKVIKMISDHQYYIFNKPIGVVSHNPQFGEKCVMDFFADLPNKKLFPLGRLDKESEGLMIITDDTRLTEKILDEKYAHEKEYSVRVDKELKESFARKMEKGVYIEDYLTKPAKVRVKDEKTFNLVLTEGKKHQIRRMCVALGYQVKSLKRVRIMNIKMSRIRPGQKKPIDTEDKNKLLKILGF